jgi:ribokinase
MLYVKDFANPDQEAATEKSELQGGGSAANVAIGVSRLGKKSGFIGKIGSDSFGKFLIDEFKKEKVDTSGTKIEQGSSSMAVIIVNKKGQRILYLNGGVQSTFSKNNIKKGYIQNSKFISLHSIINKDAVEIFETAAKYASQAGVSVLFDPGFKFAAKGIEKFRKILANTTILKLNSEEVKVFTDSDDMQESFKIIKDYGPQFVVVTLGENGCVINDGSRTNEIKVPVNVQVVDTTGAGDAFSAALISALIDKKRFVDACKFANLVAAVSTTKPGARSVPTLSELRRLTVLLTASDE